MSASDIIRIPAGAINNVNDSVIGNDPVGNSTTLSQVAGQLGKVVQLDDSQLIYKSSIGTVFGGMFQYVRLAAAASAVVVGQIVFWDQSVADNLFQVTTLESGSTPGAQLRAGIVLNNSWAAGNYSYIQIFGPTFVKFRAVLTEAGQAGCGCFAAAAGAGADNGLADVIGTADPATFGDVSLMESRFLGNAGNVAPTGGSLTLVNLTLSNPRG